MRSKGCHKTPEHDKDVWKSNVHQIQPLFGSLMYTKYSHCLEVYCTPNTATVWKSIVHQIQPLFGSLLYTKYSHCLEFYCTPIQPMFGSLLYTKYRHCLEVSNTLNGILMDGAYELHVPILYNIRWSDMMVLSECDGRILIHYQFFSMFRSLLHI